MNWMELLPVIIPSVVAVISIIVSFVLKMGKDKLKGMSKEVAELLVVVCDGYKDGKLTTTEIKAIIKEGQDVIDEARLLLFD